MSSGTIREQGRGRRFPALTHLLKMPFSCNSRFATNNGGGIFLVVCGLFTMLTGCGSSAKLVNESDTGGTVIYPYMTEADVLASPTRQDALRLLETKCPGGYRISREGQVARISPAVDRTWKGQISSDGQVSREKQWAIVFSCK